MSEDCGKNCDGEGCDGEGNEEREFDGAEPTKNIPKEMQEAIKAAMQMAAVVERGMHQYATATVMLETKTNPSNQAKLKPKDIKEIKALMAMLDKKLCETFQTKDWKNMPKVSEVFKQMCEYERERALFNAAWGEGEQPKW